MTIEGGYPSWLGKEGISPSEWNLLTLDDQALQVDIHYRQSKNPDYIPIRDPVQALRDRRKVKGQEFASEVPSGPILTHSPYQEPWTAGIEKSQPKGDRE